MPPVISALHASPKVIIHDNVLAAEGPPSDIVQTFDGLMSSIPIQFIGVEVCQRNDVFHYVMIGG
jgi:hypothetical protein